MFATKLGIDKVDALIMFISWMLGVDAEHQSFLNIILRNGENLVELSDLLDEPLLSQGWRY
jgi:hypothetical protein